MTNLDKISSLRKIYPGGKMLNISGGFNIGGMSRPTTSQSDFKPKGKKGTGTKSKKPMFDISSLIKEASEHNRMYWKEELEKIVKEFGFKSLSGELKELAKQLGIKPTRKSVKKKRKAGSGHGG